VVQDFYIINKTPKWLVYYAFYVIKATIKVVVCIKVICTVLLCRMFN